MARRGAAWSGAARQGLGRTRGRRQSGGLCASSTQPAGPACQQAQRPSSRPFVEMVLPGPAQQRRQAQQAQRPSDLLRDPSRPFADKEVGQAQLAAPARPAQRPHSGTQGCSPVPCFVEVRLRAKTPSGGSGPLRRASAPFAAKAAQGWGRQEPPPPGAAPFFDGRAYGPPLCGGSAPATPPSKTPPHRPFVFIPAAAPSDLLRGPSRPFVVNGAGPPSTQAGSPSTPPPCTAAALWRTRALPCPLLRGSTPAGENALRRLRAAKSCGPAHPAPRTAAGQGWGRQTPAAPRGYALFWRSGLRPPLVRGRSPRNAPVQNQAPRVRTICLVRRCALIQRYILPGQKRPSEDRHAAAPACRRCQTPPAWPARPARLPGPARRIPSRSSHPSRP